MTQHPTLMSCQSSEGDAVNLEQGLMFIRADVHLGRMSVANRGGRGRARLGTGSDELRVCTLCRAPSLSDSHASRTCDGESCLSPRAVPTKHSSS